MSREVFGMTGLNPTNSEQTLDMMSGLGELMTCTICHSIMFCPCMTSCGHTFCYKCLYEWFKDKDTKSCPDCRTRIRTRPAMSLSMRNIATTVVSAIVVANPDKKAELDKARDEAIGIYEEDKRLHNETFPMQFSEEDNRDVLLDREDGVSRCPRCHWELNGGYCYRCVRYYDIEEPIGNENDSQSDTDSDSALDDEPNEYVEDDFVTRDDQYYDDGHDQSYTFSPTQDPEHDTTEIYDSEGNVAFPDDSDEDDFDPFPTTRRRVVGSDDEGNADDGEGDDDDDVAVVTMTTTTTTNRPRRSIVLDDSDSGEEGQDGYGGGHHSRDLSRRRVIGNDDGGDDDDDDDGEDNIQMPHNVDQSFKDAHQIQFDVSDDNDYHSASDGDEGYAVEQDNNSHGEGPQSDNNDYHYGDHGDDHMVVDSDVDDGAASDFSGFSN